MTACIVQPNCPNPAAPGIVRCEGHERRRIATREHMRRKRAQQLAAAQRESERCAFKLGPQVCGGPLRAEVDRTIGTVQWLCGWCERRKAGVCRDCPRPVYGTRARAIRCEECHRREKHAAQARYRSKYPEKVRGKGNALQEDPERRQRKLEYKRAWRQANRDKVRQQKRRAALKQPQKVYNYMKRYRQKHREHYREMARERYYRLNPDRPAPVCEQCSSSIPFDPPGRPPKRCDACVSPAERLRREEVRARRAAARAAAADVAKPARRKPVRRPPAAAVRLETSERLCLTPGCTTPVSGRTKKCSACKADQAVAAQARIGVGRGRRSLPTHQRAVA